MGDCVFCNIIEGEVPSSKVYEDDKVLAFLDISPINKGHTLVIPKEHHETLIDTPEEVLSGVIKRVKKVAEGVKEAVGADGINIGVNNDSAAGQVVFHVHFHVIPRFKDDGLKMWPQGKYEEGEMEEFKEKIERVI